MAALPLWWLLTRLGNAGYLLALAALVLVSVLVAGPAQDLLGQKDHPAIVIDEVAGLLVALALVKLNLTAVLAGFLLFRAFDILKPWPISRLNRGTSGLAVVLDDLAAGVMARLVLGGGADVFWGRGLRASGPLPPPQTPTPNPLSFGEIVVRPVHEAPA